MERHVILASKSPRRREILENLGLTVHVLVENPEIRTAFAGDEEELPGEKPDGQTGSWPFVSAWKNLLCILWTQYSAGREIPGPRHCFGCAYRVLVY